MEPWTCLPLLLGDNGGRFDSDNESTTVKQKHMKTTTSSPNKHKPTTPTGPTIPTTTAIPVKEITFQDLGIKDKLRLREICLTLGKLEQEKNELIEARKKDSREHQEAINKLTKKNESLQNEVNTLKGKLNQNAIMLRTYQTKLEEIISDNVEIKKKREEDKATFKVMFTHLVRFFRHHDFILLTRLLFSLLNSPKLTTFNKRSMT